MSFDVEDPEGERPRIFELDRRAFGSVLIGTGEGALRELCPGRDRDRAFPKGLGRRTGIALGSLSFMKRLVALASLASIPACTFPAHYGGIAAFDGPDSATVLVSGVEAMEWRSVSDPWDETVLLGRIPGRSGHTSQNLFVPSTSPARRVERGRRRPRGERRLRRLGRRDLPGIRKLDRRAGRRRRPRSPFGQRDRSRPARPHRRPGRAALRARAGGLGVAGRREGGEDRDAIVRGRFAFERLALRDRRDPRRFFSRPHRGEEVVALMVDFASRSFSSRSSAVTKRFGERSARIAPFASTIASTGRPFAPVDFARS